jgi:hypothetical protein
VKASAQALPREPRRTARRSPAGAPGRPFPVQLELFGLRPAPPAERPQPSPPAPLLSLERREGPPRRLSETELLRRLSRLTKGRLSSLSLTDNRRTILTVKNARAGQPIALRIHRSAPWPPSSRAAREATARARRSP